MKLIRPALVTGCLLCCSHGLYAGEGGKINGNQRHEMWGMIYETKLLLIYQYIRYSLQ